MVRLSRVLLQLRNLVGWSQKDAAEEAVAAGYPLRMDGDAWSKIEREAREPTFENARSMLQPFGVTVRFFLDGQDVTHLFDGEVE